MFTEVAVLMQFVGVCVAFLVFSSVLGRHYHCCRRWTDFDLLPHLHLQVLLPPEEGEGFQEGFERCRRSEECPNARTFVQREGLFVGL